MTRDWYMRPSYGALGAALALAATAAIADPSASQTPVPQSLMVAQNTAVAPGSTAQRGYPPLQAGVRQAAAQGPVALRRYIWRTRMIFNYYYPDWVKFIPD